jgi:hypothetical protein
VTGPVITVTPTVMSGIVVRWYRCECAAAHGHALLSASRDGVHVTGRQVPEAWLAAAARAHHALRERRDSDVAVFATHRRRFPSGELEPITAGTA